MRMKYIYYYYEPILNKNYQSGVTSAEGLPRQYSKPIKIDFDKILTITQICNTIDLFLEGNIFMRSLELDNGNRGVKTNCTNRGIV